MIIGVFARRDHPAGYGFGERAHGYVVVLVECADVAELRRVEENLDRHYQTPSRADGWYSGPMDLVATVTADGIAAISAVGHWDPRSGRYFGLRPSRSLGDNRFVACYTAAEVLEGAAPHARRE